MFYFWLLVTLTQLTMFLFPAKNWKWYALETRCVIKRCGCRSRVMYQVVENPAAWRFIKDEAVTIDFVNTMWTLVEQKSMTKESRANRDIQHYFAGRRGPI